MHYTSEDLSVIAWARLMAESGRGRRARLRAGIGLVEAAETLGVHPSTLWRWEQGDRHPRRREALAYAALLKTAFGLSGP